MKAKNNKKKILKSKSKIRRINNEKQWFNFKYNF